VKAWDVIVIGAGVIGLSLARRLRQEGVAVLVIEKGEPAREATYAAGGMIAYCDPHLPSSLQPLACASAAMYPEFVHDLHDESGESADLRDAGTIWFAEQGEQPGLEGARCLSPEDVALLDPFIVQGDSAFWLPESSVDPRALGSALLKAAKHRGVDFVTGSAATEIQVKGGRTSGVTTAHSFYPSAAVVNCAGAWASQIQPFGLPTRPVKGQMVCVVPSPGDSGKGPVVQHVIRTPDVYVIPRSDGRLLLGATVEEAGFDKGTDADTVQRLHQAAANVVPVIGEMRLHDAWAGLRPGSPDDLPILGETSLAGYFAATGHYRDGIMLAPVTAQLMTQLLTRQVPDYDLQPFSPLRFA
jgi:glycine oxidase